MSDQDLRARIPDAARKRELRQTIADAPHLRWWDTINMAVHLAKMAQDELDQAEKAEDELRRRAAP